MRHTLSFSLLTSMLMLQAHSAEDIGGMFKEGKTSGQIRLFYVDRDYSGDVSVHRNATAIGGHLKYETGGWNGVSAGAAFYTTNGLGLRADKATNPEIDPTLLGKGNESYTILGEAYLQYKNGNTTFKGGRQKIETPLTGTDDVRMVPNLFEAYLLTNTELKDTMILAGHITKFAQGTFGRVYNAAADQANGILSATSGYSLIDSRNRVGEFVNMGSYAIGENTAGVSVASITYAGIKGLKLQLWDYYAHDIMNAIYAEANYGWSCENGMSPYIGIQWINERDVGSNHVSSVYKLNKIKSDYVGAKMGMKLSNVDLSLAFSHNTGDADAALNGGTFSPWGGMPAYTQGMVTRHQFMAGTDAWKAAAGYDWKDLGINLNTSGYYTSFHMDPLNGYSHASVANHSSEFGFDMIYFPESVKNLQLRFRGNFPREFQERTSGSFDWDEYRVIANYTF